MKQIDFYLKFVILILGVNASSIVCLAQEAFPVTCKEYNERELYALVPNHVFANKVV